MSIETLEDIVEGLANQIGVYGACKGRDENENDPQQMLEELDCFIVDVPKGPYTVTDYYNSNQFEEDGVNGYATIVFDGESV